MLKKAKIESTRSNLESIFESGLLKQKIYDFVFNAYKESTFSAERSKRLTEIAFRNVHTAFELRNDNISKHMEKKYKCTKFCDICLENPLDNIHGLRSNDIKSMLYNCSLCYKNFCSKCFESTIVLEIDNRIYRLLNCIFCTGKFYFNVCKREKKEPPLNRDISLLRRELCSLAHLFPKIRDCKYFNFKVVKNYSSNFDDLKIVYE